jgi:hypothetical protein
MVGLTSGEDAMRVKTKLGHDKNYAAIQDDPEALFREPRRFKRGECGEGPNRTWLKWQREEWKQRTEVLIPAQRLELKNKVKREGSSSS